MGDQANFTVTQLKSSGPSHKRINNRSLGDVSCKCGGGGGGRGRLTSCMDEYLPLVNICNAVTCMLFNELTR